MPLRLEWELRLV